MYTLHYRTPWCRCLEEHELVVMQCMATRVACPIWGLLSMKSWSGWQSDVWLSTQPCVCAALQGALVALLEEHELDKLPCIAAEVHLPEPELAANTVLGWRRAICGSVLSESVHGLLDKLLALLDQHDSPAMLCIAARLQMPEPAPVAAEAAVSWLASQHPGCFSKVTRSLSCCSRSGTCHDSS